MFNDLLTTYKLGWKTSYYQNTYDYKTDASVEVEAKPVQEVAAQEFAHLDATGQKPQEVLDRKDFQGSDSEYEEYCEACNI
jgi:ribonucleoside-diphosphate reductase alpha chain